MAKNEQQVKVKLSSARVGHKFDSDGRFTGIFSQAAGDTVTVPAAEAKSLIEKGYASPVAI